MQLSAIHTYPVKSCYRLDHTSVTVEPWGLAGDRRWLVVDPDGRCVTQREVAGMARVRPVPQPGGGLVLGAAAVPDLAVPQPAGNGLAEVSVHGQAVAATPAGAAADQWLSALLGREVRLVWLDDPTRRPVDQGYGGPDDRVSFADAYPLLLTSTASLDALNGWLLESGSPEGPLPMNRFRPNVVVAGAAAWAEDDWVGRRLRIGQVMFRVVKPCDRCVVTTTDQETGERGHEPLRALGRHRNINQKLLFGVNLIPDPPPGGAREQDTESHDVRRETPQGDRSSCGVIATGDPVALVPDR
jgi:uncharacterized protein